MASTFKVAVAGKVFDRLDKGELKLDQMVSISPDRLIESDVIASHFIHPGLSVSIYNLLEVMLTESDNTATDYLVDAAGGPGAVTAWVRAQGVEGLRVDGGTDAILRRFFNLGPGPFSAVVAASAKADPQMEAKGSLPQAAFDNDPRDTASPDQMARLLTRIFSGQALSADSTRTMIAIMERCRTGAARLRGMLPLDAKVAHKTGTIGGTVNDVGVITLPQDAGQVVVAVFIKGSDAPEDAREKTIAQIGRAVRDYYLFAARR
jgi:beta-lactamase class A